MIGKTIKLNHKDIEPKFSENFETILYGKILNDTGIRYHMNTETAWSGFQENAWDKKYCVNV